MSGHEYGGRKFDVAYSVVSRNPHTELKWVALELEDTLDRGFTYEIVVLVRRRDEPKES